MREKLKFRFARVTGESGKFDWNLFLFFLGLLNGPVFRKFSYRQVAFFGASLVAISLFITSFCSSFWSYLIFYSMCYGKDETV